MAKRKVLWVDDQIDLLKSHIIFLNSKGYDIDTCTNGNDALSILRKIHYDAILLDENNIGIYPAKKTKGIISGRNTAL